MPSDRTDSLRDYDVDDPLAAAKGCICGLVLSVLLIGLLAAIAVAIRTCC